MAKTYWMRFGSGDPRLLTGLNPTFLIFATNVGPVTPPAFSEAPSGSGLYNFTWGTTTSIAFLADAATTSPGATGRYVTGSLDPADRIDEVGTTLIAIGTTLTAISTSLLATSTSLAVNVVGIGSTASSFGTSSADPVDLFGYLKRIQENLEGNNNYIKTSGTYAILSRLSATLAVKTITNSVSMVVKT